MSATPAEIIRDVEEHASEYLEEVDEPRDLLVAIMANKLAKALGDIEYLERRLNNASNAERRCN